MFHINIVKELVHYNAVKPNLKGSAVLLRFRHSFGLKKAKIKKNSGLDISFSSSNRFGLNVFGLTVLYCNNFESKFDDIKIKSRKP